MPIGFLLRRSDARLGWGLMILGPLAAAGLAPTYFLERTVVDDKGFDARIGFWGMYHESVAFDDVKTIRVEEEEARRRRSTRKYEVLYFDLKNGGAAKLALGNDLNIDAGKEILKKAGERGIRIVRAE